ncbi:MAG: DUF6340 family protein [Bacteroidales bacterium]
MDKKLLLFFSPLLFVSCISLSSVDIQVLEPASEPLPTEIESVVIINRVIINGTDQKEIKLPGLVTGEFYNQVTTEVIFSLADILNESPGIDFIENDNLLEIPGSFPAVVPEIFEYEFVDHICDSLGKDGIISLDVFFAEFTDSINLITGSAETGWTDYFRGDIKMNIVSLWRTYGKTREDLVDEYVLLDTLHWIYSAYTRSELVENLPSATEALMEAAYYAALDYARRVAPYWKEETRYYFSKGNRHFRLAAYYIENGQLERAESILDSLLESYNKNVAAAAAYNLAYINELKGNYRQALNHAMESYQLNRHPVTSDYIDILEGRLKKSRELDRQLGMEQ